MNTIISLVTPSPFLDMNISSAYIFGAIIAAFILGYLTYTLINPDKF